MVITMGKFDGILLCSDLDGTLFNSESEISERNRAAAEYFMAEGGLFSIVTGRAPDGAMSAAKVIKPNVPSVLYNGVGIYDFSAGKILWGRYLDDAAKDVVRLVQNNFPESGLIVCAEGHMYYDEANRCLRSYYRLERGEASEKPYEEISERWVKALFITDSCDTDGVRKLINESEYAQMYSFMQSSPYYYEILPKGANKSEAINELVRMCGIENRRTVCVGDGENDALMLKNADLGITMSNAMPYAKETADIILKQTNNEDAIAFIIENIL